MEDLSQGSTQHDLGVLFVHGIGSPRYADTLLSCGEPFLATLTQWAEGAGEPAWRISPRAAVLRPPASSEDDPAWSSVDFVDAEDRQIKSWLLAESWWSTAFAPPSYGRLASWTSQIAPWAVAFWARRQFGSALTSMTVGVVRDYERLKAGQWGPLARLIAVGLSYWRIIKLLVRVLLFLLALLLIPFLIAIVLLLLLIGLLPIPQLRSFIRNVQSRLTNSIGDSFVLVSSPMQAAAIKTRVEQSLLWLTERAKRVVVVAHSQGAAIAHRVIRNLPVNKHPRLFVSLGSGLKQLTEIEHVQGSGRRWYPLVPSVGLVLLTLSMPAIYRIAVGAPGVETTVGRLTLWAYMAVLGMLLAQVISQKEHPLGVFSFQLIVAVLVPIAAFAPGERFAGWVAFSGLALLVFGIGRFDPTGISEAELSLPDEIRWLDYYSTHDPVPNGALLDDPLDHYMLESFEVYNRASVLSDHVVYWANPEGFVLPAALAVAEASELADASTDADDPARVQVGHYRRRWRVRWLTWLRSIVFASWIGLAYVGWDDQLLQVGESAWEWFRRAYDLLPFVGAENLQSELSIGLQRLAGSATLLLGALLSYAILLSIWKAWDVHDTGILFARRDFPVLSWPMIAFVVSISVATLGAGLLVDAWEDMISTTSTIVAFGVLSAIALSFAVWKWRNWSRSGPAQEVLEIRATHLKGQLQAATELAKQRKEASTNLARGSLRFLVRALFDPARAVIVYTSRWRRLDWTATLLSQEAASLALCLSDKGLRDELLDMAADNSKWAPAAVMLAKDRADAHRFDEAYAELAQYEGLGSRRVREQIEVTKDLVHDIEGEK